MNGLTQIKDKDGILYDVQYDLDFERFLIFEHDRENVKGNYFTSKDIQRFLETKQIIIVNDGDKVFEKYLN
jgi:hypothetical protein